MIEKFPPRPALALLVGMLVLTACGRNGEGPAAMVERGPEYSIKIPQPDLDGDLAEAFGKLGLEGQEVPAIPEIPSESALADPDLLERALKAYRELLAFADRLLPVLEKALEGLEGALGEVPVTPPGAPGTPGGAGTAPTLRDLVEGARDQLEALRDLAGEMAAMLDFLKSREGHFAPGGLALSFEFPEDARVYRDFRRRLERIGLRVQNASAHGQGP